MSPLSSIDWAVLNHWRQLILIVLLFYLKISAYIIADPICMNNYVRLELVWQCTSDTSQKGPHPPVAPTKGIHDWPIQLFPVMHLLLSECINWIWYVSCVMHLLYRCIYCMYYIYCMYWFESVCILVCIRRLECGTSVVL